MIARKHIANFETTDLVVLNHQAKMAVPVPADASSHIAEKHSLNSQPTSDDGVPENSISSTDGRKEKSEEGSSPPEDPGHEYLTSLKLFFVLCGVTLVCFLVMLDTSIISTVSSHSRFFPGFF